MSKPWDPDVLAIKRAVVGLSGSTSRQALLAAIDFINDYFVFRPSKSLPEHLRAKEWHLRAKEARSDG